MNEETIQHGFALWITGLPSSGKSTISKVVIRKLQRDHNISLVQLESDELRKILTPHPDYSDRERDWFYQVMLFIGVLLIRNGVNVLFDATANRRKYRDEARRSIHRFLEVYVKCPLELCMARDPKGIYRNARKTEAGRVPGLQQPYEEPLSPEVIIQSDAHSADEAALLIMDQLKIRAWI